MLPIVGFQVADIMAVLHDVSPNPKTREALLLHAYHCKVAADRYLQIMLDLSSAEDPDINAVAHVIKMLVTPAFRPKTGLAEILPFPSGAQPTDGL